MYIATSEDLELELIRKIGQLSGSELTELYSHVFKIDNVVINDETHQYIYEDDSKWCSCDEHHEQDFVDDTPKMKHHWRCSECKKITQIG